MKYTASIITSARIVGAFVLLLTEPLSAPFYTIYALCCVSNILDGYSARKTNAISKFGETLGSIADFVLIAVMLVIFIPLLAWEPWMLWWLGVIALVRFALPGVGYAKQRAGGKQMEKNEIFTKVQKCLENVPVILIGTGGTIPLGIPGMRELSEHLIRKLSDKYKADANWETIVNRLNDDIDLESALTDIPLSDDLVNDIVIETWQLIANADIEVFSNYILGKQSFVLSGLIDKFYQVHPKCVNIVTSNYDRVIEYACDQKSIRYDTRYHGGYIRYFSSVKPDNKNVVNIFKVHGSLDLFKDSNDLVCSIPGQHRTIPTGFSPEIISPGTSKYKAVLTSSCRSILHESDTVINSANSFLCIGYGFNDEQIQKGIILKIRAGKPIVVVTKTLSDNAAGLLANNSSNYVVIEENPDKSNSTRFIINKKYHYLEGTFWTIDGLLKII